MSTTLIGLSALETVADLVNVINVQLDDARLSARIGTDASEIGFEVFDESAGPET